MSQEVPGTRIDKLRLAHYFRNYEEYLGPIREQPIKMLELGIAKGDSLKYWHDWLPRATIAGLDINPAPAGLPADRIRCYQGEQQDTDILDRIGREVAPEGFDVIIDDASHVGQLTRLSFWHLYDNHLKPGALYFIEDWGTGYWPAYPDGRRYTPKPPEFAMHERLLNGLLQNSLVQRVKPLRKAVGYARWNFVKSRFPSHVNGMVGFVKELVDECGMADITRPELGRGPERASRLEWIRISQGHVVVKKPQ